MAKTQVTPRAKYPDQTQFIKDVQEALDKFEEHVHFPDAEVRENACRTLLEAYRTALVPIWKLAWFADIEMVLKTIADKQMAELTMMNKRLAPPLNTSQVSKEARKVPDLEMLAKALKDKHPSESLPNMKICAQIRDVFSKLASAHKAHSSGDAHDPGCDSRNPCVPCCSTTPPQAAASTVLGRSEIIKYTKLKVLPDPDSPELIVVDKNSATRVLVVAIYLKVEHLFFDDTSLCMDKATAF